MKLETQLKNYDPKEIIPAISALFLDKRNMGAYLTIQQAVFIACKVSNGNNRKEIKNVRSIVNLLNQSEESKSIYNQQDPPEDLFTDLFPFHGGNYVTFPGITTSGNYINELLGLTVLSTNAPIKLPRDVHYSLFNSVMLLLKISNQIAVKAGIKSWETYPESQSKFRSVHAPLNFLKLKNAVIFNREELEEILNEDELSLMDDISISFTDIKDVPYDPQNCVLSLKPLIKIEDNIVVADPSGILSAIRNEIISKVLTTISAEKFVIEMKKIEMSKIRLNLKLLHIYPVKTTILNGTKPFYFEDSLFQIDSKRICYLQVIFDDFEKYNPNYAFDYYDSKDHFLFAEERHKKIHDNLLSTIFKECEFLHLMIHVPSGRTSVGGFNYIPEKTITLSLTSEELETVAGLRNRDQYFFWKFCDAIDELRKKNIQYQKFSYLDMLSHYLKNKYSFYMTDEFRPNMISFTTDLGRNLREEKAHIEKRHNAHHDSGYFIPVIKKYIKGDIPIYLNLNFLKFGIEELVEKNKAFVWCNAEEIDDSSLQYHFTEALSYWVWQVLENQNIKARSCRMTIRFSDKLKKVLKETNYPSINAISSDKIISLKDLNGYANLSFEPPIISINLTENVIPLLLAPKNEFDRCLVKLIVLGFHSITNRDEATDEELDYFVNQIAPYGLKKKLLIVSSFQGNHLLYKGQSPPVYVSEYFCGKWLDDLGDYINEKLFDSNPKFGPIDKDKRFDLLNFAKEFYLNKLLELVSDYDYTFLISRILDLNEALIHEKNLDNLTFFTSIECFHDIKTKTQEEIELNSEKQSSFLSARFLIELIYCTGTQGIRKEMDNFELQEILSVASQYISWGMASEEIRCQVYDHQYSYLKSNRIGIDLNGKGKMSSFSNKRLEEILGSKYNLNYRKDNYQVVGRDFLPELKRAFEDEYGIAYDKYINVCSYLVEIAINSNNKIFTIDQIIGVEEFTSDEINHVVKLLTLDWRKNWEEVPDGYEVKEVFPWRFKRIISFLRKPILKFKKSDKTLYAIFPNALMQSLEYQLSNFLTAGFGSENFKSKTMRSLVGKIAEQLGTEFEAEVENWLNNIEEENLKGFRGLEIGPNCRFKHMEYLGDIDILFLDKKRKEIVILELKAISGAKTPVEISSEINNHFYSKKDGKKTSLDKHLIRFEWAQKNSSLIIEDLKLEKIKYKFKHAFLTDSVIPSTFLRTLPKNVASFESIRWEKFKEFRRIYQ